jgi:hypothetical protein
MKNLKKLTVLFALCATFACTEIPGEAHFTRGQPEDLLSVSNESVNIDLNQRNALVQLTNWVNRQEPSNAVLNCSNMQVCSRAANVLDQFGIPYERRESASNIATLNYERIMARDCENRFITNHINPYNLNHPTYGCSTAVNIVQMVKDKRQFTDPLVLGDYDGFKGAQNYDSYLSREFEGRVIRVEQESVIDRR